MTSDTGGLRGLASLIPSLGTRAAVAMMFLTFLLADLSSESLHVAGLTGVGFAAGSAAAAGVTRRRDLLLVVTMPPAIFLVAVTCAELISLHLNHVTASAGRTAANVFLTLSSAAPWLFGGFIAALVIATVRGLPGCVRELRAELTGRRSLPSRRLLAGSG